MSTFTVRLSMLAALAAAVVAPAPGGALAGPAPASAWSVLAPPAAPGVAPLTSPDAPIASAEEESLRIAPGFAPEESLRVAPPPPGAEALIDSLAGSPVEYLWVLRGTLGSRASIDSVVARARRMRVRGLLVQVVGRGDACYRSDILPPAEFLREKPSTDFDPFSELIAQARGEGLEVHAWVNCMLVWSAPRRPRDPRHVLNAHPEWVARLRDGRAMTAMSPSERQRRGVEGVFLAPGHPGVRDWLTSIACEITERYPVDGIHLDYIRHPKVEVGYDATSRARFAMESGVDPARLSELPAVYRRDAAAAWERFQRDQVTAVVRSVRDSVRARRPEMQITAAVIADTITAERANAQMWRSWVRDGLVDRAFLMCYAPAVHTVIQQLSRFAREFGPDRRIVPGIAMYNTRAATAALKIKGARALGYPEVALYSYDSLFEYHDYWTALRTQLDGARGTP